MNREELFSYIYKNFIEIFRKRHSSYSIYHNRIGYILRLYAYLNPDAVKYVLYRIIEVENNDIYAINFAVDNLLEYEIDVEGTNKYINGILSDCCVKNAQLRQLGWTLDKYKKGYCFRSIVPKEKLFTGENVRDYISFLHCVYCNSSDFIRNAPFVQKLIAECVFVREILDGGLVTFCNKTNKLMKEYLIKYAQCFDKDFIKKISTEIFNFNSISQSQIKQIEHEIKEYIYCNHVESQLNNLVIKLLSEIEIA